MLRGQRAIFGIHDTRATTRRRAAIFKMGELAFFRLWARISPGRRRHGRRACHDAQAQMISELLIHRRS